jgi:AcrR family transcriptional regulator
VPPEHHPDWLRMRRLIRHAAARLAAERGVLRTTPRAITRAARLPSDAFAACYESREALLSDIVLHHLDGLTSWVIAARDAAATETSGDRFEAMIGAFLASSLAERNEHRLLLRSADLLPDAERRSVHLRCNGLAALFGDALTEAAPRSSRIAVRLASLSLMGALSCAVLWFDPDGNVPIRGYAHMLAAMAVQGARGRVVLRH